MKLWFRSGLAHDLLMLVIALIELITEVIKYLSGATNYVAADAGHIPA